MNPGFYLRTSQGHSRQVWQFDSTHAVRLGVTNPQNVGGSYFEATPTKTVREVIAEQTPWMSDGDPFRRLTLAPGHYYPRIARPLVMAVDDGSPLWSPKADPRVVATNRSQLEVLVDELLRLCRTIHPEGANLDVFGQNISNLLILASTEVEMNWRGVLKANGYTKDRPSTKDYALLAEALGLGDYAITYPRFPWLDPIAPFASWDARSETKSLPWYEAYHGVKHNREAEQEKATLRRAFEAVTGCAILIAAQFGRKFSIGVGNQLSGFFHFEKEPSWSIEEGYCHSFDGPEWSAVPYPLPPRK